MLTVKFELHDASIELPEKSGEYLVFAENLWVTRTAYSTKWGKFNVHDTSDDDTTAIEIYYWAKIPTELKNAIRGKALLFEDEDLEL